MTTIDIEILITILRMYKEDVDKLNDRSTIDQERRAICTELSNSIQKLINKLNDKRIGMAEGGYSGT